MDKWEVDYSFHHIRVVSGLRGDIENCVYLQVRVRGILLKAISTGSS